jgi:uncharacterized protein (UPF0332 family)
VSFLRADYLAVARDLTEKSESGAYPEAFLRSAISRAYYAALLTARHLLGDQWGIEVPQDADIHHFISRWFLAEQGIERKEVGEWLERLRLRRRRADYEDEIRNPLSLARMSLSDAQAVIDRVSTL